MVITVLRQVLLIQCFPRSLSKWLGWKSKKSINNSRTHAFCYCNIMHRKTFPSWFSVLSVSTSCRWDSILGLFSLLYMYLLRSFPFSKEIAGISYLLKISSFITQTAIILLPLSLLSFTTILIESHSTHFFTSLTYYQWCIYWLIHRSYPYVVFYSYNFSSYSSQNPPPFVSGKVFTPSLLFFLWSVLVIFLFGLLFLCPNHKY